MGYTHYWYVNKEGDQRAWSDALVDVAEMIRHAPVTLRNNHGEGDGPECTDQWIGFNGDAEARCTGDASCNYCGGSGWMPGHDLAHETCIFYTVLAKIEKPDYQYRHDDHARFGPGDWYFECCKTARKPYDVMVVAALCRMAECGPATIHVSSDGEPSDWEAGRQLGSLLLGRELSIPQDVLEYETA